MYKTYIQVFATNECLFLISFCSFDGSCTNPKLNTLDMLCSKKPEKNNEWLEIVLPNALEWSIKMIWWYKWEQNRKYMHNCDLCLSGWLVLKLLHFHHYQNLYNLKVESSLNLFSGSCSTWFYLVLFLANYTWNCVRPLNWRAKMTSNLFNLSANKHIQVLCTFTYLSFCVVKCVLGFKWSAYTCATTKFFFGINISLFQWFR